MSSLVNKKSAKSLHPNVPTPQEEDAELYGSG